MIADLMDCSDADLWPPTETKKQQKEKESRLLHWREQNRVA